jgi:integrase
MRKRTGYLICRGKVFHAVWTVAGKKFMRSTGERDRRKAETVLRRIMEPFAAVQKVDLLRSVAAKIEGATAELTRIEDERNPLLTVSAAWTVYASAPGRPDSGERTLSDYEGYFTAFAAWLMRAHPTAPALRDVTPAIAGEYSAHLVGERRLSANSFNKHVRFLALLFRVLKEPARLTANPWEGIQRKRVIIASRRELTTDELKTVCLAASGEMRLLFAVGIYTGLRLGDAATLRWAEVDLHRRIIRRIPAKIARRNPRPVIIPIHPTLAALLNELPTGERREYVLPDIAALYQRAAPMLSNRIQEHFAACGVRTEKSGTGFVTVKKEDGEEKVVNTGKRAVVEVGFHSLRHTFVSLCRESNAPLSVVEAIVGHSNPAMTRHYTHVSELAAMHAVNALPSVIGEASALPPAKSRDDQLRDIIESVTPKTWQQDKVRLLAILDRKR